MFHGLDYDDFWRRTPAEVTLILEARAERVAEDQKARRGIAWLTGHLVGIATHAPSKYPEAAEVIAGARNRRVISDPAEMDAFLKRWAQGARGAR